MAYININRQLEFSFEFSDCLFVKVPVKVRILMNREYEKRLMMPELQLVDEKELEEDREYLMRMYPAKARLIMVMVEDECDRLEYEGSPMFAMYPDKEIILGISRKIYDKVSYREDDENLKHMIDIMLFNEFFVRRSRYKRRRKFF